ncbi:MAG: ATP synthase F1 subunit delta [Desulfovibrionaceae bacterium]
MMQNKIASRYAKALFFAMQSSDANDVLLCAKALHALAIMYEENIVVKEVFSCPMISEEEKKILFREFLKTMKVSLPVLGLFTSLLVTSGRTNQISSIAQTYEMLLDEKNGVKRGIVSVPRAIDDVAKGLIQDFIAKRFAHTVVLSYKVESALLGGFVLTVGDTVYDASLRTQLVNLKKNIKKGV